jgi:hypothetical protein
VNFNVLKTAVAKQFARMQKHQLFRVAVDKDQLFETYLAGFDANNNPIYRERTEHDCSCCKNFIRNVGDVVAIIDGKIESIWDVLVPAEPGYQVVADKLSAFVKAASIADVFLHFEKTAGVDKNFEQLVTGQKTWEHFFVNIDAKYVKPGADIASSLAVPRDAKNVLQRALKELDMESIDTVLEMIGQNSLYRGEEHKFAVTEFRKLKVAYDKLKTDLDRELFCWTTVTGTKVPGSVTSIRNTSIGSLLVDLSGTPANPNIKDSVAKAPMELEDAVKAFEFKVAGPNYKRPTALVTAKQIEQAKVKIAELGLTSALARRHAHLSDITINNILYANRDARQVLNGDVFDDLAAATSSKTTAKNLDKIEEVTIQNFIANILPTAKSIEVLLENRHASNLVSLIAPQDPSAGQLFKWSNPFSWSYAGEMADSIKERVKNAGGAIEGDLCCRLAWNYRDDLDFHMREPDGGHIYFSNRRTLSRNGGMLDLDANGADGQRDDPAENIVYADRKKMREGTYVLQVNNWSRRSDGVGFEVEIEFDGNVISIGHDKVLRNGDTIDVAHINYSKAEGFKIIKSLPSNATVRDMWEVPSQSFHKVNVLMMSPNYWDDQVGIGNKHYFFMLDGMKNDGSARGFFNEFLKDELTPHRKVMEIVGGKMKVPESEEQLSGLGFSSTQRNSLVVKVAGSFTRTIKIVF